MKRSILASSVVITLAMVAGASRLRADVFVLLDGDRITGKSVSEGKRNFRIQTAYGRIVVPRAKIAHIVREDGHDEIVNGALELPAPPPTAPSLRLTLVITGKSFWYAWDPKGAAGMDPTLRLQVRLDEETLATFVDRAANDKEIKGALVNTFAFVSKEIAMVAGKGTALQPPETSPGRIVLKMTTKVDASPPPSSRRLQLAYQVNEGTVDKPAWRDVAEASAQVQPPAESPLLMELHQEPGDMQFSKRHMKNVETFQMSLRPEIARREPGGADD